MLISEPERSPTLSLYSQTSNSLPSCVTLYISYTSPPLDHTSDLFAHSVPTARKTCPLLCISEFASVFKA